ncbi:MAG TPA: lytic transglycosylase domain-containing protein [Terracidiphilus sp.]|jgi:soluble lytic murein transglycosylase-like protein|nr:lytic transglycosylase domain-containing protein [Terracidiphilus sp.]
MLKFIQTAMIAGALVAWGDRVHAAEHVTLRNGFGMDCSHHAVVDGQMRLYLGAGDSSYVALKPDDVVGVEVVADLPPAPPASTAQQAAKVTTLNPADLHEMLAAAGQTRNLDVDLLASVVKAESNGNPHAVSRAGAQGLMQLMPSTAKGLGVDDRFEPAANVRGGSAYLDALLTRYHENMALALAAYNAGPEAVDRYHGIPPYHETWVYVARVIHEFNRRVQARETQSKRVTSTTPVHE